MRLEQVKTKLRELSEVMSSVDFLATYREALTELEEKLRKGKLNVVFVGEFNSGKTSLINALFGLNLPTNVLPETATIWRINITNADKPIIEVNMLDGSKVRVEDFQEAKSYDPKKVKFIDVYVNADVDEGITIVDTPGLSSLDPLHEEVLRNYIDEADVLLIAVDVNQGITKSLKQFIESGLKEKRKSYAIITKADTKPESASQELKNYILSNFSNFIEDAIVVSAKNNSIEELRKLLERISQEKEEIIAQSVERRLRAICLSASEVVRTQIENADLDLSEITARMKEVSAKMEEVEREIEELLKRIDNEIDNIANKASEIFINALLQKVNWIAEGLYDENLDETIEDRFDMAVREATEKAISAVYTDIENIFTDLEILGSKLAQEYNVGKSFAIVISSVVVRLREFLAEIVSIFTLRIRALHPFVDIIREIINVGLETFTKSFVINKIKEAITNTDLKQSFYTQVKEMLSKEIKSAYEDTLKDLESQKQAYQLAYEELKEERRKKKEEFYQYVENLKYISNKLTACGGGS